MDKLFKTLGDENRLRIMNLLMRHSLCVCELMVILETTQSNVSRHLTRLRNEGIITFEKKAQWIYYSFDPLFIMKNETLYLYLKERMSNERLFLDDNAKLKGIAANPRCEKTSPVDFNVLIETSNVNRKELIT